MADNTETLGNFSIQDTMEMGMGSAELINDLFEPETSTSNPDDLKTIVKEVNDPKPVKEKAASVKTIGDDIIEKTDEENKSNLNDRMRSRTLKNPPRWVF